MKSTKTLIIIAFVLLFSFSCNSSRETELLKQGNEFVKKIEQYKKVNDTLPASLSDVGVLIKNESDPPIYYERKDSIHYLVSFGTTLGESKIYYSDSKKWEDKYREMK